jgi:elongation factor G
VRVPYAEVVTYTKDLRALTRGSGSYRVTVNGYQEAPHDVTQKLVEEYQRKREAGAKK